MYWFEWPRSLFGYVSKAVRFLPGCLLVVLFERVGDQGQDFLVLVEEQAGREVSQALVGEARRGEQLETLDLTEMGALAQREEVEELGDIVPPDGMVVALFAEAGTDGGALLLDDGPLVGDGLCGAHVADELLDWVERCQLVSAAEPRPRTTGRRLNLRELMVRCVVGPARGPGEWR